MNAPVRATAEAAHCHLALERLCFEEFRNRLLSIAQCPILEPLFLAAEFQRERVTIDGTARALFDGAPPEHYAVKPRSLAGDDGLVLLTNGISSAVGASGPPSLSPGPRLRSYMRQLGLANVYELFVALTRLPLRIVSWHTYPSPIRRLEEMHARCSTFWSMSDTGEWLRKGNVDLALRLALQRCAAIMGRGVAAEEVHEASKAIGERTARDLRHLWSDVRIGYVFAGLPVEGPVAVELPGPQFQNDFATVCLLDLADRVRGPLLGKQLPAREGEHSTEPNIGIAPQCEPPLADQQCASDTAELREHLALAPSPSVKRRRPRLGAGLPPLFHSDTRVNMLNTLMCLEQELADRGRYMESYCQPLFEAVVSESEPHVLELLGGRKDLLALSHHAARGMRAFLSDVELSGAEAREALVACRSALEARVGSPSQLDVVLTRVTAFNDKISRFPLQLANFCNGHAREAVDRLWQATQTHVAKEMRLIADLLASRQVLERGVRAREFQQRVFEVPRIARDALLVLMQNAR